MNMWRAILILRLVEVEGHVNRCPSEWPQPCHEKQWPLIDSNAVMLITSLFTAPASALDNSCVCEISALCFCNWRSVTESFKWAADWGFIFLKHQLRWCLNLWPHTKPALWGTVVLSKWGNFVSRCLPALPATRVFLPGAFSSQAIIFLFFSLRNYFFLCSWGDKQVLSLLTTKVLLTEAPTSLCYVWCSVWCTHEDVLSQVEFCGMAAPKDASKHLSQVCSRGLFLVIKFSAESFVNLECGLCVVRTLKYKYRSGFQL